MPFESGALEFALYQAQLVQKQLRVGRAHLLGVSNTALQDVRHQ